MNHEALPAPKSMTRFALEALSEGKQQQLVRWKKQGNKI